MGISPVRLTVVQIMVIFLLLTLLGRLWYLQVLAGSEARQLAEQQTVKLVYEQAPRGFIFDRQGRTLARNRTALTVAIDVSRVPADQKDRVVRELAQHLGMKEEKVRAIVNDQRIGAHTPRPVALDVNKDVVIYFHEHADRFPGVTDLEIPVREYPMGALAAHVIGHIGEINADELQTMRQRSAHSQANGLSAREYRPGDLIGKLGVERTYEDWLAGKEGIKKIAVDVHGTPVDEFRGDPPERGWDAILTIDAKLQQAAENALDQGIGLARHLVDPDTGKNYNAPAGAVVALDPSNGEVLSLASSPDFDPNLFVGSAPRDKLAALNAPNSNMPFLNRAIAEAVPPGSTFKPFTAIAAWDVLNQPQPLAAQTFQCPGFLKIGNQVFKDWKPNGHGTIGLGRSLAESCDIVYYTLGRDMGDLSNTDNGEHLQKVAREFGFGSPSNIDLRGEEQGLVPDANWKWQHFSYAQTFDRRWFKGDNANLAIGQGFLQATPLQLAMAYGAIANGGTVYRPHVLRCLSQLDVSRAVIVDDACGKGFVPKTATPSVLSRVSVSSNAFNFMREGMIGTVVGDGTAAQAFAGFPRDKVLVSGKSGTAQMAPKQPFSWFAAIASSGGKQIVVVALVEEGGHGSQSAAPVVRRVIEQYFGLPQSGFEAGLRSD